MFIYHSATGLTGGQATDLDSFTSAVLKDGNTHICWVYDDTSKRVYAHVFDPDSTEAESSPDFVRPNDFSTSGVWVLMHSPFDVSAGVETGSIQIWTADPSDANNPVAIPTGYLECDGSAISRTTYSALFAVLGESYGDGDGVNTFNIPDYRGRFLRGFDNGAGIDPDAASRTDRGDTSTGPAIGTKQADSFKTHQHTQMGGAYAAVLGGASMFTGTNAGVSSHVATAPSGGNETRPTNVTVMYIIKY